MAELSNIRVAVIATDGVEESELTEPVRVLRDAGARVEILAPKEGQMQAMHHQDKASSIAVDKSIPGVNPAEYDALLLPGGALNADQLRMSEDARNFVRQLLSAGSLTIFLC